MKTHDYTEKTRGYGHDLAMWKTRDGGLTATVTGFGREVSRGDCLLLGDHKGTTRYRIVGIDYLFDPPDMWHASLEFAPRTPEEKGDTV